MLTINVPGSEFFDEKNKMFVEVGETQLELEHSLISLSKWESLWEKPFLGKGEKNTEETLSYIKVMCLTPNIPPEVFARLSQENLHEINEYINRKMTATWFNDATPGRPSSEVITSELIYYWMIALLIPLECEAWHLERLFTLIKVVNLKNSPTKKMNHRDDAAQRRAINEQRKKQFGTSG